MAEIVAQALQYERANVNKKDAMESETEDEEVKINCAGGFRGVEDSDMNTSDDDESLDGDAQERDENSEK